jgi:tRNA (guanine10-N2)-methyltransferase
MCIIRDDQPYIPPTKPYELSELVSDLVMLSRYMLKPGGRLVFFLPTVSDEYEEIDIDTMLCHGMEVVANSLQDFGSWGRRVRRLNFYILTHFSSPVRPQLITLRKTTSDSYPAPSFGNKMEMGRDTVLESAPMRVPAHRDFRQKYFQGFRKSADE